MRNIYIVLLKIAAENRLKNEASGILLRYITVTFVICMFDKVSVAVSEFVSVGKWQRWGKEWRRDRGTDQHREMHLYKCEMYSSPYFGSKINKRKHRVRTYYMYVCMLACMCLCFCMCHILVFLHFPWHVTTCIKHL